MDITQIKRQVDLKLINQQTATDTKAYSTPFTAKFSSITDTPLYFISTNKDNSQEYKIFQGNIKNLNFDAPDNIRLGQIGNDVFRKIKNEKTIKKKE